MKRHCHTCSHCKGPFPPWDGATLAVRFCDEVVDKNGEGDYVPMPAAEARRYCRGDWWLPSLELLRLSVS